MHHWRFKSILNCTQIRNVSLSLTKSNEMPRSAIVHNHIESKKTLSSKYIINSINPICRHKVNNSETIIIPTKFIYYF